MDTAARPTRGVLIRDLMILGFKLLVDAFKDLLLFKIAVAAVLFDLLFGREGRPLLFYRVLRLGERFDLWLNLYGAADQAAGSDDGLFGVSRAGANSLLGRLEQMVRQKVDDLSSSPHTG